MSPYLHRHHWTLVSACPHRDCNSLHQTLSITAEQQSKSMLQQSVAQHSQINRLNCHVYYSPLPPKSTLYSFMFLLYIWLLCLLSWPAGCCGSREKKIQDVKASQPGNRPDSRGRKQKMGKAKANMVGYLNKICTKRVSVAVAWVSSLLRAHHHIIGYSVPWKMDSKRASTWVKTKSNNH